MLKRIVIRGYKSLVDLDVSLQPLSVLFGPNAAGKSNFLDALQLLSRLATSRTLREAFEPPHRGHPLEAFTFGPQGIQGLLEAESASLSMQVDVELSPAVVNAVNHQLGTLLGKTAPPRTRAPANGNGRSFVRATSLRYRIEIEIVPRLGTLRVVDESVIALNDKGKPASKPRPFLEHRGRRLWLRREGSAQGVAYECPLDRSVLALPLYPLHHPHLVALRQELERWRFYCFEPREQMRGGTPVKEVHHLGPRGEELAALLNTLKATHPRQFQAEGKALHVCLPSITGLDVQVNQQGEAELRVLEDGRAISARLLSDGVLRMLGLFLACGLEQKSTLVGLEEPDNGIYARWLDLVAKYLTTQQFLGDSQLIVTTHSPGLLDLLPPASLYVCRQRDGRTWVQRYLETPAGKTSARDRGVPLDPEDEPTAVSGQVLRGNFDA